MALMREPLKSQPPGAGTPGRKATIEQIEKSMTITTKDTDSPVFRNRVEPLTYFRPPLWVGDCPASRSDPLSNPRAGFRWVKADGYERVHSWGELTPDERRAHRRAGHSRETWDGGYIRSHMDGIIPGDRFGHLTAVRNDAGSDSCRVRCDCGTEKHVRTSVLLIGGTLSCGGCPRCTGDLGSCGCWGCTGIRWYRLHGFPLPGGAWSRLAERRERAREASKPLPAAGDAFPLPLPDAETARQIDALLARVSAWLEQLWDSYLWNRRFRGTRPESLLEYLSRISPPERGI